MTNTCTNPAHDHELLANDEPGKCNGCRQPAHYDEGTGNYHHDLDVDEKLECILLTEQHNVRGKTPCRVD